MANELNNNESLTKLFNIFAILCGLCIVIGIHELGHFSFSKLFGVHVPTFSIGFGPKLFQKKIGQTNFALSAIPLGGFTEIYGMDTYNLKEKLEKQFSYLDKETRNNTISYILDRSFSTKPYWQKFLILIGGILFNLVFAYLVFILLFLKRENSYSIISAFKDGFLQANLTVKQITSSVLPYFTLKPQSDSSSLIISSSGEFTSGNKLSLFLFLLATISINLAIFNLFPLPILDGGQLLLLTIEAIARKPIPINFRNYIYYASWAILIIFFIFNSRKKRTE